MGVLPPGGVGDAPGLAELREGVEAAWRTYQSSPTRFSDAAHVLPVLIAAVDAATRAYRSPAEAERREAHRIAADLYALLRSYCKRAGRMSLSLLAADRGLRAAEEADDPVRIAVAQWNLGHHLVADNELDGAEMVVRQAAEALGDWRDSPESAGVYGALQLVRAVTLSRRRDVWGARAVLDGPATQAAKISGECNVGRTVFGPSNLALHRVSVEMEAGEATTALRIADTVNTAGMASIERRVTHLLEVTRCYELHRNDAAVLFHLQKAERLGPEDVHRSLMVRELVRGLRLRARPSFADDIAELAARVGLLAN
ncbi:transcriptional regulator [Yinghuangia aomiensis]